MTSNLKNVPLNWQKVRFDEIVEIATDRVEDPVESGLEYFIGLEHLDTDCIRIKKFGSSEDVCSSKFICKKGDIIFGRRRSYLRKVAITDRDAVVSTDAMVFRPSGDKIYPDFLPCFMQSSIFWKAVHANSEGSMSPRIKWKALATQEFWLPSIEEQKKISELLWSIEDNIQKTEKLIETTEFLKKKLMQKLLTKGIGHTKFKKTELGEIPEEWDVFKNEELCERIFVGIATSTTNYYVYMKGVPIIRNQNIKENQIDGTDLLYITSEFAEKNKSRALKEKDIVSVRTGYPGLSTVVTKDYENCHTFTTLISRPKECLIDSFYLCYFINSPLGKIAIKENLVGSAQQNLNISSFKNIKIIVPDTIEEQQKIVSILSKADSHVQDNQNYLTKLQELKKGLMQYLLTGKVRVCV